MLLACISLFFMPRLAVVTWRGLQLDIQEYTVVLTVAMIGGLTAIGFAKTKAEKSGSPTVPAR
jgi:hypothetical protein